MKSWAIPCQQSKNRYSLPYPTKKTELPGHITEPQPNQGTQADNVLLKLLETAQASERESYKQTLAAKDELIEQQKNAIRY